jgi:hypothetical protein
MLLLGNNNNYISTGNNNITVIGNLNNSNTKATQNQIQSASDNSINFINKFDRNLKLNIYQNSSLIISFTINAGKTVNNSTLNYNPYGTYNYEVEIANPINPGQTDYFQSEFIDKPNNINSIGTRDKNITYATFTLNRNISYNIDIYIKFNIIISNITPFCLIVDIYDINFNLVKTLNLCKKNTQDNSYYTAGTYKIIIRREGSDYSIFNISYSQYKDNGTNIGSYDIIYINTIYDSKNPSNNEYATITFNELNDYAISCADVKIALTNYTKDSIHFYIYEDNVNFKLIKDISLDPFKTNNFFIEEGFYKISIVNSANKSSTYYLFDLQNNRYKFDYSPDSSTYDTIGIFRYNDLNIYQ